MPEVSTVGELVDYLTTQPRDRRIVMSKDAEGNSHSPLSVAEEAMYVADTTWSGDVFLTPEERAKADEPGDYDEAPGDADRVVLLVPVN